MKKSSEGSTEEAEIEPFIDDHDDTEFGEDEDHGTSSAEDSTTELERREKQEVEDLIARETKNVLTWRETVTGILMITGFIASVSTFVFLGREEHNAFETSFREAALVIGNKYMSDSEELTKDAQVLSDLVTANAVSSNSTWPFVTVPFFEVYGTHLRSSGATDLIVWAPVVTEEQRSAWEEYSVKSHDVGTNLAVTKDQDGHHEDGHQHEGQSHRRVESSTDTITPYIHRPRSAEGGLPPPVPQGEGPYAPIWQVSPLEKARDAINLDLFSYPEIERIFVHRMNNSIITDEPSITSVVNYRFLGEVEAGEHNETLDQHPRSMIVAPIFNSLLDGADAASGRGIMALSVEWDSVFEDVLPADIQGIQVVVRNSCQKEKPFTYLLNGSNAIYMGEGEDVIDLFYLELEYVVISGHFTTELLGGCNYALYIYPTSVLRRSKRSDEKIIYTLVVAGLFVVIGIVFWFYNRKVQERNEKMLRTATKSNAIVSSLFPSTVRKRLFEDNANAAPNGKSWVEGTNANSSSKPLADFFPEASVLFADIVGFTAWSSVREPSQVFVLLESIYHAFDQIAKRRRIFKIETIGDCYVATAGLPEPRADHALAMARFANECLTKMHELTARLEETLGPDTGDLSMRIGIHSGPVTAGVLRGERARFQLFGDTVNTAARLESTGMRGRIHMSQETANIITNLGKGHWVLPRDDKVTAKGKGELKTFWLAIKNNDLSSSHSGATSVHSSENLTVGAVAIASNPGPGNLLSPKLLRLVNWNVEILSKVLGQIVARRRATKFNLLKSNLGAKEASVDRGLREGKMVIDEVEEIITLPKYDAGAATVDEHQSVELDDMVVQQLREFVMSIAQSYKDNPFHSFEHASHVTMSVSKLLSRIVAPKIANAASSRAMKDKLLHDHTYGITSDPLTQFACIFSALIHDAEHEGVPNTQLVKEGTELAAKYKNQSVAEQNSVDVAWGLLMQPQYKELRATIYCDEEEMVHFRRLVVNCVMATDICDKHLKDLRNKRWDRAFKKAPEGPPEVKHQDSTGNLSDDEEELEEDVNRKATIVIEHLLQASDVSHTMQHWHVFRKWNENLFREMYFAYREGRSAADPSTFWYKGEIGFFDFYVIPLAKKLKDCGVFGVSSDEYLNYAVSNRNEWEARGASVVKELAARAQASYEKLHPTHDVVSFEKASIMAGESDHVTLKRASVEAGNQATYLSVRSEHFKTMPSDTDMTHDTVSFADDVADPVGQFDDVSV